MFRRGICIAALLVSCQVAAPFAPAWVLFRLRTPVPARFYVTPVPAMLVQEADGRYVVHLSTGLAATGSPDAFAFAYLHEVGHVKLGHLVAAGLRPPGPPSRFPELDQALSWLTEFEADRWAAVAAARAGFDPREGFAALTARFGRGGGASHPHPRERLLRLHWALVEGDLL